jgi:hypothetical protein
MSNVIHLHMDGQRARMRAMVEEIGNRAAGRKPRADSGSIASLLVVVRGKVSRI